MNTTAYTEYTASVHADPSYYGPDCTSEQAARICADLRVLIERQFPGIQITEYADGVQGGGKTTGPSEAVIDEINDWISANWTAAL